MNVLLPIGTRVTGTTDIHSRFGFLRGLRGTVVGHVVGELSSGGKHCRNYNTILFDGCDGTHRFEEDHGLEVLGAVDRLAEVIA